MKVFLVALCAVLLGASAALTTFGRSQDRLVGANQCTWGPSYWCSNLTNAKGCHAVRHCIQTVWEKKTVPEDNDSICQICLDMVKQARDQLESNQTQEDLKAVFEGSCKLIPIPPVKKECMKLADDFVPELVEALASQMNPQVVCSIAGLCNNAAIDQLLLEAEKSAPAEPTPTTVPQQQPQPIPAEIVDDGVLSCSECNHVATLISDKFHKANRDDMVGNMLSFCDKLSSYSDACANIILTYFNNIYSSLEKTLSADSICHISGVCSAKFHQHEGDNIEIRPMGNVGVVPVEGDDIPCELCEQLVKHLRDVLIANTTEIEFKQVLEGLCKQSGKFEKECISIVDEYYDLIYKDLVNNLDANGACFMIGICKKGVVKTSDPSDSILPFLPPLDPVKIEVSIKEKKPVKKLLGANEPKFTQEEIENMQLPIDNIMGAPNAFLLVENGELCTLCEYFLHFVQEALATPANDEKIKQVVATTCDRLPKTIEVECHNFIDIYGDAIIALLIQGIDPRSVCPKMKMCPAGVFDMEVFSPKPLEVQIESGDKPSCPLCLLAVKQLQDVIKNDKSKENIKHALDNLCSHLPKKLAGECTDFVDTYSAELVEMLITDFTPQQICVYLKLCTSSLEQDEMSVRKTDKDKDILTNEIQDETVNGQHISVVDQEYSTTPQCLLCQHIIKTAEKDIVNKKSREQIKHAMEHVCEKMKKKIQHKCHTFVEKHGDQITDLILKEIEPKQICSIIGLCAVPEAEDLDIDEAISVSVIAVPSENVALQSGMMTGQDDIIDVTAAKDAPLCIVCEFVMSKIEAEMTDKKTEDEIKHIVLNVCAKMPKTIHKQCDDFIAKYADLVIAILASVKPKEVCEKINLCAQQNYQITDEVVDCGVCHGAVVAVKDIISQPDFDGKTDKLADTGCNSLPGKYYEKCSGLLKYYGASIVNLLRDNTEVSEICPTIGMCFKQEASGLEFVKIKSQTSTQAKRTKRQLGANKCSRGPGYWCSSQAAARECDAVDYCQQNDWKRTKRQLGANKCTRGPGYWCSSQAAARECDAVNYCQQNDWKRTKRQIGANKCAWGPGYWCSSQAHARECDAIQYCTENGWKRTKRQIGANKCAWGPGYWCSSQAHARECDAIQYCTENGWKRTKRQLGANKCTRGPGYWCSSQAAARECNTIQYCQQNGWKTD